MVTIMLIFRLIRAFICGFSAGGVMFYNIIGPEYCIWEIQRVELLVFKEAFKKAKEEKKPGIFYSIIALNGFIFFMVGFEIILIREIIKDIKKIRGVE